MSRTIRSNNLPTNAVERAARREAFMQAAPGEYPFLDDFIPHRYRGGMVMSPRACGKWDDERALNPAARKRERRVAKRAERREALREALNDAGINY